MRRSLGLAFAVAVAAASCSVSIPEGVKFSCAADADCGGGGYLCVQSVCCNPAAESCESGTGGGAGGEDGGTGGGAGGGAAGCPTGFKDCGGGCFDVLLSPEHCGTCDNACAASDVCFAGTCAALSTVNPYLEVLAPTSVTIGSTVTVALTGERFATGAVVRLSGPSLNTERPLTVTDAAHGSIDVDLSAVPSGTLEVRVVNPGQLVSNTRVLTLTGQLGATPTLASVSPALVPVGYNGALTVNGAALDGTSKVQLSGGALTTPLQFSTVFVSTSQLFVPAFDVSALPAGIYQLTAAHAAGVTNALTLTIEGFVPSITALSPARAPKGTNVTLTIDGTNFGATSQVILVATGGAATNVTTALVSATRVTAGPLDLTAFAVGNYGVLVRNNGAFDSNAVGFVVESNNPTLVSVSPAGVRQDQTVDLTLSGARFLPGAVVSISSATLPKQALTTTFVDLNTVKVLGLVLVTYPIGGYQLEVRNPGSNPSASVSLTVTEGTPILTNVNPPTASVGGTQPVVVTLTGTFFYPTSLVTATGGSLVDSPLPTTWLSPTSLRVSQDISGQSTGAYTLKVMNPASPAPLASNTMAFTLNP